MGLLNPIIAGGAMAMSSLSVVSNALLLKQWRPGYRKNEPKPITTVEAASDIGELTQGART
jgi:Cu+-exporting ATPase